VHDALPICTALPTARRSVRMRQDAAEGDKPENTEKTMTQREQRRDHCEIEEHRSALAIHERPCREDVVRWAEHHRNAKEAAQHDPRGQQPTSTHNLSKLPGDKQSVFRRGGRPHDDSGPSAPTPMHAHLPLDLGPGGPSAHPTQHLDEGLRTGQHGLLPARSAGTSRQEPASASRGFRKPTRSATEPVRPRFWRAAPARLAWSRSIRKAS